MNLQELDGILESASEKLLSRPEIDKVKTSIHAMAERLMARSRKSEKTATVLGDSESAADSSSSGSPPDPDTRPKSKPRAPGHGCNGAAALTGACRVEVSHPELSHGQACPECQKGKIYRMKDPSPVVRFTGRAPVDATVWELERLRCNLCGTTYKAPAPEEVGPEKYDESVTATVADFKYGNGIPFNRIENIQKNRGIPLPASNQWELVNEGSLLVKPAFNELIRQAAQGEVLHNDDTTMRVLSIDRPKDDDRTGVFTTGIVATGLVGDGEAPPRIALFFTGIQHAGENLGDVLERRAAELEPPIQMCDALSRNEPKCKLSEDAQTVLAICLVHGRRNFVKVADCFPEQVKHVLNTLGQVYRHEEQARRDNLTPKERLHFHQRASGPLMRSLLTWMKAQLHEKFVEPNSTLGKALKYMINHWLALTLFLRVAGAPLDNNLVEQALKKVVLHRKNSLFYKTENGAEVGDIFMSLIHTCKLNGVNSFEYLVALLRHPAEIRRDPAAWMPWNYQTHLARGSPG